MVCSGKNPMKLKKWALINLYNHYVYLYTDANLMYNVLEVWSKVV